MGIWNQWNIVKLLATINVAWEKVVLWNHQRTSYCHHDWLLRLIVLEYVTPNALQGIELKLLDACCNKRFMSGSSRKRLGHKDVYCQDWFYKCCFPVTTTKMSVSEFLVKLLVERHTGWHNIFEHHFELLCFSLGASWLCQFVSDGCSCKGCN